MRFEEVLPALRDGKAIQRTSQPIQWAYVKRSENGAFHAYGYMDDPARAVPWNIYAEDIDATDWVIVDEAAARGRKPAGSHRCGRRGESWMGQTDIENPDHWRERDGARTCSYCGSMNPDDFMARLEAGDVELTPTDKSYKVYVEGEGLRHAKFYFQHLSKPQMIRFVDLMNEKRLRLAFPGHFYTPPFFVTYDKAPAA